MDKVSSLCDAIMEEELEDVDVAPILKQKFLHFLLDDAEKRIEAKYVVGRAKTVQKIVHFLSCKDRPY